MAHWGHELHRGRVARAVRIGAASVPKSDKRRRAFGEEVTACLLAGESHRTPGFGTFSTCTRKATTGRAASTMAIFRPSAELRMYANGGPLPEVSGRHAEAVHALIAAMQSPDGVMVPHLGRLAVVPVAGKRPKLIFHGADELNRRIDSTRTPSSRRRRSRSS